MPKFEAWLASNPTKRYRQIMERSSQIESPDLETPNRRAGSMLSGFAADDLNYPARRTDIVIMACFGLTGILALGALGDIPLLVSLFVTALFLIGVLTYGRLRRVPTQKHAQTDGSAFAADTYRVAADLADSLPQAVAIIDRNNCVVHANQGARELVNIDTTGRPLSVHIRDGEINERLEEARHGYQPDPLMVHNEGEHERYIRLLFSKARRINETSDQTLTLVIFDDVTPIMVGQQQRADFLANASHELKTPIASLMGYIETLRGHAKDDPEAQERFLAIMQSQAERMQRLISDLLSLRRIEQSEHIAPQEAADLDLAIIAAVESVMPLCEKRTIKIKYDRVGKNKALVWGHQDECVQLCLNLIENAVKISPQGSDVTIALNRTGKWSPARAFERNRLGSEATSRRIVSSLIADQPVWSVLIRDEGPGFAREHIPRIGERFYRIAGDLSSKEKGTGLGLAIVKHIILRHRGGLFVRSQPGQGTEFSISLAANEDAGKVGTKKHVRSLEAGDY